MANEDERLTPPQWALFIIVSLAVIVLALFLLIVILNAGTILVGTVLTIFHVALAILLCVLTVGAVLLLASKVLTAFGESEARIKREFESLRKTALQATYKSGSEALNFVTSILLFLIQESVSESGWPYKAGICLVFASDLFLGSQLIGSKKRGEKVIGVILFLLPVALFAVVGLVAGRAEVWAWLGKRTPREFGLMAAAFFGTGLTMVFGFLKEREA